MNNTTNIENPESRVRNFRRLLRRFERLQATQLAQQDCCSGLSFAQCHPLLEIRELERATIGELAARLGLDKSTLSRTVDDLVRRRLVNRRADRRDRRFMVTTLTAEGRRVCDDINRRNDAFYGHLLGLIPNGKCDDFIDLFRQFVEVLGSVIEKRHDPNAGTPPPGDCCPPGDDDLASSTSDGGSRPAATGIPDRDGPE